jgi:long-chain acyl-CoA synthetase
VLEREFLYSMLYSGAKIVYYSGDVQKIKDDLALVKPTIFVSVPRLFSRFHDVIKGKFNDVTGWTKSALEYALDTKMNNVSTGGSYTHRVYDRVFFTKTREALGGNVRLMISGSAPLLADVHKFLKVVMCCPLLEGYGQTESTGGVTITNAMDPNCAIIGGPAVLLFFIIGQL